MGNLQDSFLNQVRKDGTEVQMMLTDGSKIVGLVKGFDNFTVILADKEAQHLVYKHAIARIITPRPVFNDNHVPRRAEPAPQKAAVSDENFNTLNLARVQVPRN